MISEEKEAIEELKILKEDYWEDDGYGYATAECQKAISALDMAIEALEQNAKLKEAIEKMEKWIHSGNRGNCDYFIVDQVEEIINGLKKDGTVSE